MFRIHQKKQRRIGQTAQGEQEEGVEDIGYGLGLLVGAEQQIIAEGQAGKRRVDGLEVMELTEACTGQEPDRHDHARTNA